MQDSLDELAVGQFNIANEPLEWFEGQDHFEEEPALDALFRAFWRLKSQDQVRGGLQGGESILIKARDHVYQTGWHIDPIEPRVRYTMALGEGSSTLGSVGQICSQEVNMFGDDISPSAQLVPQAPFKPGTVVRFILGDVHSSPSINERTMFMRDMVYLQI
jgi:hypothetical protein